MLTVGHPPLRPHGGLSDPPDLDRRTELEQRRNWQHPGFCFSVSENARGAPWEAMGPSTKAERALELMTTAWGRRRGGFGKLVCKAEGRASA